MTKGKRHRENIRQFIKGTVDSIRIEADSSELGYSPALDHASMTRRPSKRDARRKDRRKGKQDLRDGEA